MKTIVPTRMLSFIVAVLATVLTTSTISGQTVSTSSELLTNGLRFENYSVLSGNPGDEGTVYSFPDVFTDVDATVTIDSLVNGARVNNIDDNSNGLGYRGAFQPYIRSGGVIGYSYVVFSFRFYKKGTNEPASLDIVNASALDIDGNLNLKEFCEIRMGSGSTATYMSTASDLSVLQMLTGRFKGENILGIERSGIDTSAYSNMFTSSNTGITGFSVAYGTNTLIPTSGARQFSLYMKGFNYPDAATLPLELLSFGAILRKSTVELNWITLWEKNLSHFEVERSLDGRTFQQAGLVFGVGNSDFKSSYSFKNNISELVAPIIYYRLKLVDQDGSYGYSDIRAIRISSSKNEVMTVMAYPNPVVNEVKITIPDSWQGTEVKYDLFNANGRVVKSIRSAKASQTEMINMSDLGRGFYVLKASNGTEVAQQKIIKN
ncbi:MAG: T9SS type A sorting domain-containing protein [Chitinophagaceae bacterium]|nr:T9SS type A sorting domain-containing protein [Chitinophagaceae bacterium]